MRQNLAIALLICGALAAFCGCGNAGTSAPASDDALADTVNGADLPDTTTETDAATADLADAATDVAAPDLAALCLESAPNPVVFAPTAVGSGAMASAALRNCGLQGVCITAFDLQNESAYTGEYSITFNGLKTLCPSVDVSKGPSATAPCCLAPGAQVGVDAYFTPKSASTSKKTAQIWATSNAGKTIVYLEGIATK